MILFMTTNHIYFLKNYYFNSNFNFILGICKSLWLKSINFLKNKAKTLEDIYKNSQYILTDTIKISSEDLKILDSTSKKILKDFLIDYEKITKITKESIEKIVNGLIDKHKTNFKGIGQPLRVALTGSKFGPGLYNIILSLDKNETIKRLKMIK